MKSRVQGRVMERTRSAIKTKEPRGCTISKAVHDGANDIICFSLSRNTDISAEIYPYHKLIIMAEGVIEIYGADGFRRNLHTSDSIITLTDTPMGIRTAEGAVYTEVSIRRRDIMNEAIKAGEVFRLAEIVPYQDGKIVNMDVVHNDKMKFVIMAFDAGTELSEHAAPRQVTDLNDKRLGSDELEVLASRIQSLTDKLIQE